MTLRSVLGVLIACISLPSVPQAQGLLQTTSVHGHTQDLSETVVPITTVDLTYSLALGISGSLKPKPGIDATFGTGFCLDAACRFIVTNYHVAIATPTQKIKGEKIVNRYLATGPHDEGATANFTAGLGAVAYTTSRDLALLELGRPLHRHHGLSFSLDELEIGQQVDVYAFPKTGINPLRKLTRIPAIFKGPTSSGLLAFGYELPDKPAQLGGASGGIVVDRKTEKVVGVLRAASDQMMAAVPVSALLDFVKEVQPFLAQEIFPAANGVAPSGGDLYPKFEPSPDLNSQFIPKRVEVLQRRPVESPEVSILREKAQALADGIRNFIAVQSFEWGRGDRDVAARAAYEVRVIDGTQRFRKYPDGKKFLKEIPLPALNAWALGSDQWSSLPKLVGTEIRLKIHQAEDAVKDGRPVKVFQYRSSAEDNLCPFQPVDDYIFFSAGKPVAVGCYGEVWTDQNTNVLRISMNLDLSDHLKAYRGWEKYRVVVTYGWIKKQNEPMRLAPLTNFVEARYKGKEIYWCRGQFTNYQLFSAHAKLIL